MTTTNYDVNRPGQLGAPVALDLFGAVARTLFEATLWVARRGYKELVGKKSTPDTVLGHAADAASHAAINTEILLRIAKKQGVDVTDIEAS